VAAFLHAFLMPRAPGSAGVVALILGPAIYGAFQFTVKTDTRPWGHDIHFLIQVLLTFLIVSAVMLAMTLLRPLPEPRHLPERETVEKGTDPRVKLAAVAVVVAVLLFFVVFW